MSRILSTETVGLVGKTVELAGWLEARRDHGRLVFFDLRDRGGLLQLVCTPQHKEAYGEAQRVRPEWVVAVKGTVQERPEDMRNPGEATGTVEVKVEELNVLAESKTPPFPLDTEGYDIDEEKRLRYRYLDLRRQRLQKNLKARSRMVNFMRQWLLQAGFTEIETPLLTKSTPEGARDFLVPSRLEPGKFYALPQSPQQYKQLLQVAGFERYFQVARALRDEDPRGDRQAEHTQLDLEMSFVEREDVLQLTERLYLELVGALFPEKRVTKTPFPRMTYRDAMEKYGTDKPDLRKNSENHEELAFCFITDFPAFERKKEDGRWEATHNPFSRSRAGSPEQLKKDPGGVLSEQYDLALNGFEIAGGSLREHRPQLLEAAFEVMGYAKSDIREQFGHLLEAFSYGAPPHGGIAAGVDRFLSVLLGEPNIREVMAFPKTGDNRDLMMGAPSEVSEEQLRELRLEIKKKT